MGQLFYPQDVNDDTSGTSSSANLGIELPQNTLSPCEHLLKFEPRRIENMSMETNHRFESVLNKIARWHWQSSPAEDEEQWPGNLTDCLKNEFELCPEDMACLQCVTLSGSFGGFTVSVVRIFNHVEVNRNGLTISSYHDLDEHPEAIVFEGYIFKDGPVHLRKKESLVTI
jgi:hypothetical protein